MPKDKLGNYLTWREFFKRWKYGIENLSPTQKLSNESRGSFISLIGFIISFFAVIYMRNKIGLLSYGLILIFLGSIITTGLKYLSLRQQLKYIKNLDTEILQGGEI